MSKKNIKRRWRKKLNELPEKLDQYQQTETENSADSQQRRVPRDPEARQNLVERLISEAMEEGQFDNLPGAGKPLDLSENPYLEPGQAWAYGLLKRNGFAPEWVERDKTIRREMADLRERLQLAWQTYQAEADEAKWRIAVSKFEERLSLINRQIDDFNLIVPVLSAQRSRLRLEQELRRVEQGKKPTE